MQLRIKATNLELTQALKDYITEKFQSLDKYLGSIEANHCDVEVELTTHHHRKGDIFRAEVNLDVPHELLRVEKTEEDLYKAIDKVKDHLVENLTRYKEKQRDA